MPVLIRGSGGNSAEWGRSYTVDLRTHGDAAKGYISEVVFEGVERDPLYAVVVISDYFAAESDYTSDRCISSIVYDPSGAIPKFLIDDYCSVGTTGFTIFDDGSSYSSHFSAFSDGVSPVKFVYNSDQKTLTLTSKATGADSDEFILPGLLFAVVVYST